MRENKFEIRNWERAVFINILDVSSHLTLKEKIFLISNKLYIYCIRFSLNYECIIMNELSPKVQGEYIDI